MDFVLKGFDQSDSVRRFQFETQAPDHTRSTVIVSADLVALREYGIQVQSLPLLCRQHLDLCDASAIAAGRITITRADMEAVSIASREVTEQRKPRRSRGPVSDRVGSAWRGASNQFSSAIR